MIPPLQLPQTRSPFQCVTGGPHDVAFSPSSVALYRPSYASMRTCNAFSLQVKREDERPLYQQTVFLWWIYAHQTAFSTSAPTICHLPSPLFSFEENDDGVELLARWCSTFHKAVQNTAAASPPSCGYGRQVTEISNEVTRIISGSETGGSIYLQSGKMPCRMWNAIHWSRYS